MGTTQQYTGSPAFSVIDTYAGVSPAQFSEKLSKNWTALEDIKEQVTQAVAENEMTPLQAIGILACTTAQLFGYQAFHGQPSFTDVLSVWSNGQRSN